MEGTQVGVGTEGKTSAELLRCILHLPGLVLMLRAMGSLPGIGVGSGTQRTLAAYWGTWPVKAMGPGAPLPSLSSGVGGKAPGSAAEQGNGAENNGIGGRSGTDCERTGLQHHLLHPVQVKLRSLRSVFSGCCTPSPSPLSTPVRGFHVPPLPRLHPRCCESSTCLLSQGKR